MAFVLTTYCRNQPFVAGEALKKLNSIKVWRSSGVSVSPACTFLRIAERSGVLGHGAESGGDDTKREAGADSHVPYAFRSSPGCRRLFTL